MSKNGDHDGDLRGMKVLLADQDEGALRIAAALVRDLGHEVTELAVGVQEAAEVIARKDPDLSIVVVYEDDGFALDLIVEITEYARGPVIAMVAKEDPEFVGAAAKRGIYAYAREGMADSIKSGIEAPAGRHAQKHALADE